MRIVVASVTPPFGERGRLADDLAGLLRAHEHVVEQIWLPVDTDPERRIQRDLGVALTDVSDAGELLIALRPPSHLLTHPNKVVWFAPNNPSDGLSNGDRVGLSEALCVFSACSAVRELLRHAAGIDAPLLAPELLGADPAAVVAALVQ